ncbi:unnamed protein product [Vitrella brassicaformis CCMP3155]|uniref:1,3-beta-glucan synthase n=3 Tax=Vitrella brassicaformis TaxID=1169539 RepID=A0A0G4ED60_VITBC|nr:unnamed protein product [Vitrella brassicaformis CCMP3155]|eukprot:CEL93276.1 unnamed protein product [Vitrella brassicaformis CCMP3155]
MGSGFQEKPESPASNDCSSGGQTTSSGTNVIDLQDGTLFNVPLGGPRHAEVARLSVIARQVLDTVCGRQGGSCVWDSAAQRYGFQADNVANQKEDVTMTLINMVLRDEPPRSFLAPPSPPEERADAGHTQRSSSGAVTPSVYQQVLVVYHEKVFRNYRRWCSFLGLKAFPLHPPHAAVSSDPSVAFRHLSQDIALYRLVWGEAANLRHCPELLCFIFHWLSTDWTVALSSGGGHGHAASPTPPFIDAISPLVQKMWDEMRKPTDNNGRLNYDDWNELCWNKCVVSAKVFMGPWRGQLLEALVPKRSAARKTFVEQRSYLTVLLAFSRIYSFNIITFFLLITLAVDQRERWASREGRPLSSSFSSLSSLGRPSAWLACTLVIAMALGGLKELLELCLSPSRPLNGARSCGAVLVALLTLQRTARALASLLRLVFAGAGLYAFTNDNTHPWLSWNGMVTFPFLCFYVLHWSVYVWAAVLKGISRASRVLEGACERLVHWAAVRHFTANVLSAAEEPGHIVRYSLFWLVVWGAKLTFSYFYICNPLLGATSLLWQLPVDVSSSVGASVIKALMVLAVWLPTLVRYFWDTQLFYAILQAIWSSVAAYLRKVALVRNPSLVQRLFHSLPLQYERILTEEAAGGFKLITDTTKTPSAAGATCTILSCGGRLCCCRRRRAAMISPGNKRRPLPPIPVGQLVSGHLSQSVWRYFSSCWPPPVYTRSSKPYQVALNALRVEYSSQQGDHQVAHPHPHPPTNMICPQPPDLTLAVTPLSVGVSRNVSPAAVLRRVGGAATGRIRLGDFTPCYTPIHPHIRRRLSTGGMADPHHPHHHSGTQTLSGGNRRGQRAAGGWARRRDNITGAAAAGGVTARHSDADESSGPVLQYMPIRRFAYFWNELIETFRQEDLLCHDERRGLQFNELPLLTFNSWRDFWRGEAHDDHPLAGGVVVQWQESEVRYPVMFYASVVHRFLEQCGVQQEKVKDIWQRFAHKRSACGRLEYHLRSLVRSFLSREFPFSLQPTAPDKGRSPLMGWCLKRTARGAGGPPVAHQEAKQLNLMGAEGTTAVLHAFALLEIFQALCLYLSRSFQHGWRCVDAMHKIWHRLTECPVLLSRLDLTALQALQPILTDIFLISQSLDPPPDMRRRLAHCNAHLRAALKSFVLPLGTHLPHIDQGKGQLAFRELRQFTDTVDKCFDGCFKHAQPPSPCPTRPRPDPPTGAGRGGGGGVEAGGSELPAQLTHPFELTDDVRWDTPTPTPTSHSHHNEQQQQEQQSSMPLFGTGGVSRGSAEDASRVRSGSTMVASSSGRGDTHLSSDDLMIAVDAGMDQQDTPALPHTSAIGSHFPPATAFRRPGPTTPMAAAAAAPPDSCCHGTTGTRPSASESSGSSLLPGQPHRDPSRRVGGGVSSSRGGASSSSPSRVGASGSSGVGTHNGRDPPTDGSVPGPTSGSPSWRRDLDTCLALYYRRAYRILTATKFDLGTSEARRRLKYFMTSMFMDMPEAPSVAKAMSLTTLIPYYEEDAWLPLDELYKTTSEGVTKLEFLQSLYPSEWQNFLERKDPDGLLYSCSSQLSQDDISEEELRKNYFDVYERLNGNLVALDDFRDALQQWASFRGQTLCRTIRGVLYNTQALQLQAYVEEQLLTHNHRQWSRSAAGGEGAGTGPLDDCVGQGLPGGATPPMHLSRDRNQLSIDDEHRLCWESIAPLGGDRALEPHETAPCHIWRESNRVKAYQRDPYALALSVLKYQLCVAAQVFGRDLVDQTGDSRAALRVKGLVDMLQQHHLTLRVACIEEALVAGVLRKASVFYKWCPVAGRLERVYRILLPHVDTGDGTNPLPAIGEGKPENQNAAMIFTRGELLQTIDMNMDSYFEEALKLRNLTQEFAMDRHMAILGFREHVFTDNVSAISQYMAMQETCFTTMAQRHLDAPLRVRLHYGHPDIFCRAFVATCGSCSKASLAIHVSEDIFAGYNAMSRGLTVKHVDYCQVGKGRDNGLAQVFTFERKIAQGNGEQVLTRDVRRLADTLDPIKLCSIYHSGPGFFINGVLSLCGVFMALYGKLFLSVVILYYTAADADGEDGDAAPFATIGGAHHTRMQHKAFETTSIMMGFEYPYLYILPLFFMIAVERGLGKACEALVWLPLKMAPLYYAWSLGTKASYLDSALLFGGARYVATGRGFAIEHEGFTGLWRLYFPSHFEPALELSFLAIFYYVLARPSLAMYLRETWSIHLLSLSFLYTPFIFNPLGFDYTRLKADFKEWQDWMHCSDPFDSRRSWYAWWRVTQHPKTFASTVNRLIILIRLARFALWIGVITVVMSVRTSLPCAAFYLLFMLTGVALIGLFVFLQDVRLVDPHTHRVTILASGSVMGVLVCWAALARGWPCAVLDVFFVGCLAVLHVYGGLQVCIYCLSNLFDGLLPNYTTAGWVTRTMRLLHLTLGYVIFAPPFILAAITTPSALQGRILFNGQWLNILKLGIMEKGQACKKALIARKHPMAGSLV